MNRVKCSQCLQANLSPTKHGMKCWACGHIVLYDVVQESIDKPKEASVLGR